MSIREALDHFREDGYCLWVGAGVSKHLSRSEGQLAIPMWHELTEHLEGEAHLQPLEIEVSFPERIERVHRRLGVREFQAILRTKILNGLADSILCATLKRLAGGKEPIPQEARQIAKLGHLANPIVNFNIEPLTSLSLACAGGPCSIKSYVHPAPATLDAIWASRLDYRCSASGSFPRHVYHPHGVVNLGGICVMTATDYRSHQATLGFRLAVHSAFMSNLAIVGMSLDDEYLREQLTAFRQHIRHVFWFAGSEPTEGDIAWASCNGITVLTVDSWPAFWKELDSSIPDPEPLAEAEGWRFICQQACACLDGEIKQNSDFMESLTSGHLPAAVRADQERNAEIRGERLGERYKAAWTEEQLVELFRKLQEWVRSIRLKGRRYRARNSFLISSTVALCLTSMARFFISCGLAGSS